MTVDVARGNVVLTISPPRAHHIAMVIDGARPNEEWMREAVRLMLTAADRLGIRSELVPRLSRRQFLRDWQPEEVAAALTAPVVDVPATEVAASLVHAAAAQAAELAQAAVKIAADRAAAAASTARAQRSAAVEEAAEAVATRVAKAAAAVESDADAAALTVAQAAFDAAFLIASTITPGSERDAALTATLVATAVSAIAIKTAAITASARADVAREAATAASTAAVAAADAAKIVDLEVVYAAEAVRAVATKAALNLAALAQGHRRPADLLRLKPSHQFPPVSIAEPPIPVPPQSSPTGAGASARRPVKRRATGTAIPQGEGRVRAVIATLLVSVVLLDAVFLSDGS